VNGKDGACTGMGEIRKPYKILIEIPEGMRPPTRSKRRRDDNIRIDLREIEREDV
jgi:hypothetical protein